LYEVYSRYFLSSRDSKRVLKVLETLVGRTFGKRVEVEVFKTRQGIDFYAIDGKVLLWSKGETFYPTLLLPLLYETALPKITVDEGAVPHVLNGADIMRPGVVSIEGEFEKNDTVVVFEEKYRKPICISLALYSSDVLSAMNKGKVFKNIHYLNDKLWKFIVRISKLQ